MASKLLTPTYKWTPSEKTTYATPKPATITPTYKWTPSEKTTYATPKPVTMSPTYNWTPSEKTKYVTPNTPTIAPNYQWTPSKVPTSKAKTLTPTALNRGESSSVPTVEGVDVSGMAISAQKQLKTSTGGSKTITKLGENSYNVVEKDASGKLIRSVNVKPDQVTSTLGVESSQGSDSKLSVKSTPGTEKIIDKLGGAAGGSGGDSTKQKSSTATAKEKLGTLKGFDAPATPQGFDAPAIPATFEAPETPETFVSVLEKIQPEVQYPSGQGRTTQTVPKISSYVKADGSAGELSPSQYAGLGSDQKSHWRPVYSDETVESPSSELGIVSAVLNAPSSQEEVTVEASPTDWAYGFPETDKQKEESYRLALEKYNSIGETNGDNDLIVQYFAPLVPYIVQQQLSAEKLADQANAFLIYRDGEVSKTKGAFNSDGEWVGEILSKPFDKLDYNAQTEIFRNMIIDGANNEVPVGYTLLLIDQLIDSESSESTKRSLSGYVRNGQLDNDVTKFGTGSPVKNLLNWVSSDSGLTSIGAIAGLIGIGASLATGGLAAAGGSALMSVFSTTELKNAFGHNAFVDKAKLQNEQVYAQDHKSQYNEIFKSTESKSYDFSKYYKDQTPEQRLSSLAALQSDLEYLGERLGQEHVFLEYMGIYDQEVERYHNLRDSLKNYESMVDSTTGELTSARVQPAEITLIPPAGGYIEGEDLMVTGQAGITLTKEDQGMISYKVYDGKGNLVKTDTTSYYPGNVITKDYTSSLAFESTKGTSETESMEYVRTIYLQPGQSMEYNGKVYTAKDRVIPYDIKLHEGIPTRIKFSQDGKESKVEYFGAQGVAWGTYTPVLDDAFTKAPEEVVNQGFKLITSPDSVVKINGRVFSAQGEKNVVPVAPGYYSVEVSTPGKETWQKTVYIGEGQYMSISDASQDAEEPYTKSYSSGGSGGGGGGSSGGSGGSASYALIVYGETCRGAQIWQDDIEVAPEIGKAYSISPGYHGIVVKKTGKKDWTKTVYCMAGDSVTVSPSLEDADDTNGTDTNGTDTNDTDSTITKSTRRVYFNSDPMSARVMVNGGFSGEWTPCFLDLEYGYYKIQILKTGYKAQDHTLYVGNVIAWDTYADQLAKQEGIYYD